MIIPEEYYKKEIEIKLTQAEIDLIIEQLEFVNHNLFEHLNLQKIIDKLRLKLELNKQRKIPSKVQKQNNNHEEKQGDIN